MVGACSTRRTSRAPIHTIREATAIIPTAVYRSQMPMLTYDQAEVRVRGVRVQEGNRGREHARDGERDEKG